MKPVLKRDLLEQIERTEKIIAVLKTNLNNKSFVKGVNPNELSRLQLFLELACSELARANVATTEMVKKYEKLYF